MFKFKQNKSNEIQYGKKKYITEIVNSPRIVKIWFSMYKIHAHNLIDQNPIAKKKKKKKKKQTKIGFLIVERKEKENRKLPDGGDTWITTVNAVERGGSIPVNRLLDGNAFRVANDGVWRDRSGLVRILCRVVRHSHHRFIVLRHLSVCLFACRLRFRNYRRGSCEFYC